MTGYKHAIDLTAARALLEQTRTPTTPNFAGQAPAKQVQGIDGDVAFNVAANGNRNRIANEVTTRARRANIDHHPLTILRAALDPAARITNVRTQGNETLVDVTTLSHRLDAGHLHATSGRRASCRPPPEAKHPRCREHRDQLREYQD